MRARRALLVAAVALGGCVMLPIPVTIDRFGSEKTSFLTVGSTTKEEVLLTLGQPDWAWRDEAVFVYQATSVGYVVTVINALRGGDPENRTGGVARVSANSYLLIAFDRNELVERFEVKRDGPLKKYALNELQQWNSPEERSGATMSK